MTSSRYLIPTVITKFDIYGDNTSQDDISSFHTSSQSTGWSTSWEDEHPEEGPAQRGGLRISIQSPPSQLKPSARAFFGLHSPPTSRRKGTVSSTRTLTSSTATESPPWSSPARSQNKSFHAEKIKRRIQQQQQQRQRSAAAIDMNSPPAIPRVSQHVEAPSASAPFFDERLKTPKATPSMTSIVDTDTSSSTSSYENDHDDDDNETFTSDGGRSITERAAISVLKAAQKQQRETTIKSPSAKANKHKQVSNRRQRPSSRLHQPSPSALTRLRASESYNSDTHGSDHQVTSPLASTQRGRATSRLRQPSPSRVREKSAERTTPHRPSNASNSQMISSKQRASASHQKISQRQGATSKQKKYSKNPHTQTTPRSASTNKIPMRSPTAAKAHSPEYQKQSRKDARTDAVSKNQKKRINASGIQSSQHHETPPSPTLRVVGLAPRDDPNDHNNVFKGARSLACASPRNTHRGSPKERQRTWQDLTSEWDSIRQYNLKQVEGSNNHFGG